MPYIHKQIIIICTIYMIHTSNVTCIIVGIVNLAVLNALPLPALDGGQFVFVLIEILFNGKKLPRNFQEQITAAAFGLLLLFSASTLVNDISHINDPIPGLTVAKRDSNTSN